MSAGQQAPTLRQQLAAALPAHTYHETTLVGWRCTWSTPTGIWSVGASFGVITVAGPNASTDYSFVFATAERLLDLLRVLGAVEIADETEREATPLESAARQLRTSQTGDEFVAGVGSFMDALRDAAEAEDESERAS